MLMKNSTWTRLLTTFLVLLGMLSCRCFGQTIQSTNPNTVVGGATITMIITGANTNFTTVTGIYLKNNTTGLQFLPLNFSVGSATNMVADFTIPPNASLGMYRLEGYGHFSAFPNALNVTLGPGSAFGQVSGKVITDNNSNCVEDIGDAPIANAIITLTPGPYYITTGTQGDFSAWIPNGTYTAYTNGIGYGSWVCGGNLPVSIPTSLSIDANNDFYWHFTPYSDQSVDLSVLNYRPGFSQQTWVTFRNSGNTAINNAVGTVEAAIPFALANISPVPTSINGNIYTFNFGTIPANGTRSVVFSTTVPVNTPLGAPIAFSASFPPVGADPNLNNNTSNRFTFVSGSFDPNDKRVWDPSGNMADGPVDPSIARLDYAIRFQNTGNDTAFNIIVKDTLSSFLNPGTLRVTGSSHPYQLSMTGTGFAQFTFPNILLVDSVHNEPASHGYINYSIDLDPGVPVGTIISNRASIYFDFNLPIVTNRTNTVLCTLLPAAFSAAHTGPNFTFTNQSGPSATSWQWSFGDGGTSTLQNPTHIYAGLGPYVVCLAVSNSCRTTTFCDTVYTCQFPFPAFTSTLNGSVAAFANQSHPSVTSWAWDFGDGGTSTLQNPTHTYTSNGTYTVCLTTTNPCTTQTVCQTMTICRSLNEAFTHAFAGPLVAFQDLSDASATGWAWTFGDGGTSTLQNPSHAYAVAGTYNVCLTVVSSCSTATTCHAVTVCPALNEAFASSVSGYAVAFNDLSDPSASTWAWTFGDGGTSSLQNPTHIYANGTAYNVCLTVSNPCFSATTCAQVDLCEPTNEAINYTLGPVLNVDFTGAAAPSVNVWNWTFGDGGTSILQNPSHTYATAGNYQVCLQVSNACSSSVTCTNFGLVGLNEVTSNTLKVFPNPSAAVFQLEADLPSAGTLRMRIYDARGVRVDAHERYVLAGPMQEWIDLSQQSAGLYLLQLEHEGLRYTIRLQKL